MAILFVFASAPESPNRTSFHRRQQAMPSRSILYACGPTPTTDLITPRPHSSCESSKGSMAGRPPLQRRRRWPPPPSRCRQRSRTAPRHWVGTCPPSSRRAGDFFAVLLRPSGDFAGLAGLKTFVMLASFRAFAPKLRKHRLLPTHGLPATDRVQS